MLFSFFFLLFSLNFLFFSLFFQGKEREEYARPVFPHAVHFSLFPCFPTMAPPTLRTLMALERRVQYNGFVGRSHDWNAPVIVLM